MVCSLKQLRFTVLLFSQFVAKAKLHSLLEAVVAKHPAAEITYSASSLDKRSSCSMKLRAPKPALPCSCCCRCFCRCSNSCSKSFLACRSQRKHCPTRICIFHCCQFDGLRLVVLLHVSANAQYVFLVWKVAFVADRVFTLLGHLRRIKQNARGLEFR